MGDAAREPPDLLHLLRLAELLLEGDSLRLGLATFADVSGDTQDGLLAAQLDDRRTQLDRNHGSVPPHVASLEEGPALAQEHFRSRWSKSSELRRVDVGGRHGQ